MKRVRLIALAVLLIISTLVVGFLLIKPADPLHPADEFGVCIHLSDFDSQTEAAMVDLGIRWVRIDWNISGMSNFMERMWDDKIQVLAIIDHNTLNQQNFTLLDWQGNVSAIMGSDDAKLVDAWEIWNEPNNPSFYLGYMDGSPEHYFEMLKVAYNSIKLNSNALVVSAGLSPNDTFNGGWQTWLSKLQNLGSKNYSDIQGIHLYYDLPSTNLEKLNSIKVYGMRVWITEIGRPSSSENYTPEGQATYLSNNLDLLASNVDKVFWYELKDNNGLEPPKENYFGLITTEFIKKPSYEEFRSLIS
jgi:hypothetical protein